MANLRKLRPNTILEWVEDILRAHVSGNDHLVVALSGGVDSVVLLHLLHMLSRLMMFRLSAVHVEHGISPYAAQWSDFCQNQCSALGIPIQIFRLKVQKVPQVSLEAAARQARYQVFKGIEADYIVLAHHQDDQVETVLLQLLRGAGVKGLAGMPVIRKLTSKGAIRLLRPLLNVSRETIMQYARQHHLSWVDDESNSDTTYNRNFLRHAIFPLLEQRYPAYRETCSRASYHLGEAAQLLDELAEIDSKCAMTAGNLHIDGLRQLSFFRAKNLLRYLFSQYGAIQPNTLKLEEILRQLLSARTDTKLYLVFDEIEIRCFKGLVRIQSKRMQSEIKAPFVWRGEYRWVLESLGGMIECVQQEGVGINPAKLIKKPVTVRLRAGGERFQPDCKRPRRSLKKILQEASLPPWERGTLPLLFSGEHLVWVPGIGVDCTFQALPGELGLMLTWRPNKFD
ncbi:tRNA lysidine(34) synthetase TilS [Nitrosomonas sp. Is37]|uniref:tRNA lysidine(34) synthetase TilS n=1 Tax=Nitrosomonas sp. Is37 TaxID=3080535 RepID=UPI00294AD5BE|nr:tRNA lysidine(34) synthetase TilS [Nitrosomonas sp. Is37]MDV6343015.1 tRNA lysidine(34) synthetase TilS [Nitrosomonas sp. Is37]